MKRVLLVFLNHDSQVLNKFIWLLFFFFQHGWFTSKLLIQILGHVFLYRIHILLLFYKILSILKYACCSTEHSQYEFVVYVSIIVSFFLRSWGIAIWFFCVIAAVQGHSVYRLWVSFIEIYTEETKTSTKKEELQCNMGTE